MSLLAAAGLRPVRAMGQHFLVDARIHDRIVAAFAGTKDELAVEIGAGLGFLTERLLDHLRGVVAIERDEGLARILSRRLARRAPDAAAGRLLVVLGDAMEVALRDPPDGRRVRWLGNLPYHIAVPLLLRLARSSQAVGRGIFLLQRELAQRLTAPPGTRQRGVPTVLLEARGAVRTLFGVAPSAFWPVPRVGSTAVEVVFAGHLRPALGERLAGGLGSPVAGDPDAIYDAVVRAAFAHRRKILANALGRWAAGRSEVAVRVLARLGLADRRAEHLTVEEFAVLSGELWTAGAIDVAIH